MTEYITEFFGSSSGGSYTERREPIVRCRDCRHYQDHNFGSKLDWCRYFHYDVHLDGFCKWGERK